MSARPAASPPRRRGSVLGPVAGLFGFAAVAGAFRVRAFDVFWHLAAGRWIAAHGQVPRMDPFRFTSSGATWVDHEWLFEALLYGAWRLVGLDGLVVLRAAATVLLAAVLLAALRRSGAPTTAAVAAVLVAVLGARPRLFLRPELVTLLALATLLWLLAELRRSAPRRRFGIAAAAVALTAVWANAHPGALAAPVVALAFLVGTRLPGGLGPPRRGERPVPWRLVVGLPALLGTALLANPYGVRILAVPLAIGGALHDLAAVNPEWLPVWSPAVARDSLYFFLAFASLAALALLARRRSGRLDPASGLVATALTVLAATSIRHQTLFYVGAAVFAGECLADLAASAREAAEPAEPAPPRRALRRPEVLVTVACALALTWVLVPPSRGPLAPRQGRYTTGLGLERGRFPVHLVDHLDRWSGLGHLYNNSAWGGYLLWRLYPRRQVFSDGRNEVDPDLLRELGAARRSSTGWEALLARYRIDGAVVRYEDRPIEVVDLEPGAGGRRRTTRRTANAVLFPRSEFALVAWDDTGMLLVRRRPGRAARLAELEYRYVDPEDWRWSLARAAADPAFRRGALAELRRRLAEPPRSRRAEQLTAALARL